MSFRARKRPRAGVPAAGLVAAIALGSVTAIGGFVGAAGPRTELVAAAAATSPLPFDMPSPATLRASGKNVFAHYVPSMPISVDNRPADEDYYTVHYNNPRGEAGRHRAYGGLLRDRPIPRPVNPADDWVLQDAQTEVRQAISAGLDGFTYNIPTFPTDRINKNWYAAKAMLDAARSVDPAFKIVLMPDMTTSPGRATPRLLAQYMAELGSHPSAFRLGDGRLVVSPFLADRRPPSWWRQFFTAMQNEHGIRVALVPVFLDERPHLAAFAPISHGIGNWGARNPALNDPDPDWPSSRRGRVAQVHRLDRIWMQPVSLQDARPRSGIYDEAGNSENLRLSWEVAIRSNADWVQFVSWNDYSEGSHMAPSARSGWSALDISAYYLTWYKTGSPPAIRRDVVYLSNRGQFYTNRPTFPQTRVMLLRLGGTGARNTVEALTFLTRPGTVTVTVGSRKHTCEAPAGVAACTVPLGTGPISVRVTREGVTAAAVVTARTVTTEPYVQDLEYAFAGSGRAATDTTARPGSAGSPSPAPASVTRTLDPVSDTYVYQGKPGTNFGRSASLATTKTPASFSLLRFRFPAPPPGKRLRGAVLHVTTNSLPGAGSSSRHEVRLSGEAWKENTVTWRNRVVLGPIVGTVQAGTVPKRTYRIGLDAATVSGLSGERTLAIATAAGDDLWLWSKEYPVKAHRPQLVLFYG